MKIITWQEMLSLEGDIVWAYHTEDQFPEQVFIQYSGNFREDDHDYCKRLCEESFPILKPEYEDCLDYQACLTEFNTLKEGKVSSLETSGDVANREEPDAKIIIYDKEDIAEWINKLKSLNIKY